ncbi:MAG: hypothetical protein Q7U75_04990 [Desulfobacterales bacterium]|nr:hypothetical protein [Desulfobacterales bacterium]
MDNLPEFLSTLASKLMAEGLSSGILYALVGFATQIWVRGEWPSGRLNQDSPKVVDPTAFTIAASAAIVAGVWAVAYFNMYDAAKDTRENVKAALMLITLGYMAADLRTLIEKFIDLIKKIPGFLADLPKRLRGS